MKERLYDAKLPICAEKYRIITETLESCKSKNIMKIRAACAANFLKEVPIFIEEDDIIAGNGASKPNGLEVSYETGFWDKEEIDGIKSDENISSITISDDTIDTIFKCNEIIRGDGTDETRESLISATGRVLGSNERLWPFLKSGVTLPPWKSAKTGSGGGGASSGLGMGPGMILVCPEYEKVLNDGARKMIDEAKQCIKEVKFDEVSSIEKLEYWESVIEVLEGWIRYSNRHAELAEKMASEEKDEKRKTELLKMADTCRRVPEFPAESFYDAIHTFWFTLLMNSPAFTAAAGRFDQFMYPFYKTDIQNGKITDEEVLELIEILRIKTMKLNSLSGAESRKRHSGLAKWYNFTIGGVKEDGTDAVNELTYLMIEAAKDTQLPHFTITMRVDEVTSIDAIVKGLEVVKSGLGMPAFISDKSYMSYFMGNGITLEDARNYVVTGCLDGNVPGLTRCVGVLFFLFTKAFEVFMHNGYDKQSNQNVGIKTGDVTEFKTFEDFNAAFKKQFEYLLRMACERNLVEGYFTKKLFPDPFRSALMRDGIKTGQDIYSRVMKPFDNGAQICCVGGVDTTDSLTAIKKLIFDEKKYTMEQLTKALDSNWEGCDAMRKDFMDAPKYGNDEDVPDEMLKDLYNLFCDVMYDCDSGHGGKQVPAGISISGHHPAGMITGALPNGHKAGEVLTDGSISPSRGADKRGPLAVFKSAAKIDQDRFQATLLNMKFHPSSLQTKDDMIKLAIAVKTYLTTGGKHVQFNVVSKETLEAAKAEPKKYSEIVVRVAGYSAYFCALTAPIQDEVIERTAFAKV